MTAQQLKNSILQMAVQGKLVPQDPTDEPASVLLERIRAEKKRLIKEKKIKREKNPSVIFKGADNTPYEKIGDEVRSLADEVPFDIPDSWGWVRVCNCTELFNGRAFKPSDWTVMGLPIVRIQNLNDEKAPFNYYDKPVDEDVHLYGGELLFAWSGTPGTSFGAHIWRDQEAVLNQHIFKLLFDETALFKPYYMYALNQRVGSLIKAAHGSAGLQHVTRGVFESTLIPLPPFAEQIRIVEKLNVLFPIVEHYSKAYDNLNNLQSAFPEALKKSILQEAIQGKLVPQDPSDEPAEALLERIQAEKQRLIKEGKIKKDKHESIILRRDNSHYEKRGPDEVCIDDEIPFELPSRWAWARLSSFGVFSSGKTPSMSNPQFWNGNIPWVTSKDMKRPVITDSEMHISELAASTMQLYPAGTLLLVARSGILKRLLPLCKLGIDSTINQDIKAFSLYDIELSEWLFYGIKAFEPYILKELVKSVTTVESLKFDEFAAMLIPVPPLSEQKRIIAAIKAAMNLLTPLSSNPLFSL